MRLFVLALGVLGGVAAVAACKGGGGTLPDSASSSSSTSSSSSSSSSSTSGGPTKTDPPPPPNTNSINASNFTQTCIADPECIAVYEGRVCNPCKCPNAAINSKDKGKYDVELAQLSVGCEDPGDVLCEPCDTPDVGCDTDGKCATGITPTVFDAGQ